MAQGYLEKIMVIKKFRNVIEDNDERAIIRRGTYWNLVASILNASMSALILFFISLIDKSYLTGFFSIATAIAYQCQAVGFLGVRNFHISDVKKEYCFSDYVYLNSFSSIIMILMIIYFSFLNGYSNEKALIVFGYCLYRSIDIVEGLLYDEYQRQNRLDIGLILQTFRFFISLVFLIITLIITKNLVVACFVATGVSLITVYLQNKNIYIKFKCRLTKFKIKRVKKLLYMCIPIAIAEFINLYLVNAAKYSIDTNSTNEIQSLFAILVIPVFTISMLSTVIYRPYITKISEAWCEKKYGEFLCMIKKQILVILTLTGVIVCFGYIIGLDLLGMIYNLELKNYMQCFILLLIGGGINTLSVFLNNILIIIREQNKNMFTYIVAFLITLLLSRYLVTNYLLLGASILYIIPSLVIVVIDCLLIFRKIKSNS